MERIAIEIEQLATNPMIGFRITDKMKADLIDGDGQKWDVKAYQSYLAKSDKKAHGH